MAEWWSKTPKRYRSPLAAAVNEQERNVPRENRGTPTRARRPCKRSGGCPGVDRGLSPAIIAQEGRANGVNHGASGAFTPEEVARYRQLWQEAKGK